VSLVLKSTAMTVNRDEILAIKRYVNSLGSVDYRVGEELRPTLDGHEVSRRLALSESEWLRIKTHDPDLWDETCRKQSQPVAPCTSGQRRFHIDAYGRLQLCSGNRQRGYDLRTGSFEQGFYEALPSFPCEHKVETTPLIQVVSSHA
jgi:hypothetical protein